MSPASETRQSLVTQLRGINRDQRTVTIVFTDYSLDSYGTRIDPNGWDFEQFKKNPVICLQHDTYGHSATMGLPIAKGIPESIRREKDAWLIDIQFPEKGKFPAADIAFELIADGFLRACSVGFDPVNREIVEETDQDGRKQTVTIFRTQRLFEISIVTIPANDNALIIQKAKEMNREADVETVRAKAVQLEDAIKQEVEKTEERKIGELSIQVRVTDLDAYVALEKEIAKWRSYFENKQEPNRASTKVLERFYKRVLKEDPPENETQAWEKMGEAVEALPEKEEEKESTPETKSEEKKEETPPAPAAEAPQPERKAFVRISLPALHALPRTVAEILKEATAEAQRNGMPQSKIPTYIDDLGAKLKASFLSSPQ